MLTHPSRDSSTWWWERCHAYSYDNVKGLQGRTYDLL
jgi:hypothetical protein